ncbi:hypothetical protein F2P81_024478 [Scophthalmus maximus]|uniref:Uncharacterized protein n=1 Tax=Scophthalmus maximus TaxID=52904 RepID=A0A6A4RUZ7_SCOMX|nr:hypothetical protein F2P81_024478 [Scophthalmus maximus]
MKICVTLQSNTVASSAKRDRSLVLEDQNTSRLNSSFFPRRTRFVLSSVDGASTLPHTSGSNWSWFLSSLKKNCTKIWQLFKPDPTPIRSIDASHGRKGKNQARIRFLYK